MNLSDIWGATEKGSEFEVDLEYARKILRAFVRNVSHTVSSDLKILGCSEAKYQLLKSAIAETSNSGKEPFKVPKGMNREDFDRFISKAEQELQAYYTNRAKITRSITDWVKENLIELQHTHDGMTEEVAMGHIRNAINVKREELNLILNEANGMHFPLSVQASLPNEQRLVAIAKTIGVFQQPEVLQKFRESAVATCEANK